MVAMSPENSERARTVPRGNDGQPSNMNNDRGTSQAPAGNPQVQPQQSKAPDMPIIIPAISAVKTPSPVLGSPQNPVCIPSSPPHSQEVKHLMGEAIPTAQPDLEILPRPSNAVTEVVRHLVAPHQHPLLRNRPLLPYRPVSERVATMASNASSTFDAASAMQRLHRSQLKLSDPPKQAPPRHTQQLVTTATGQQHVIHYTPQTMNNNAAAFNKTEYILTNAGGSSSAVGGQTQTLGAQPVVQFRQPSALRLMEDFSRKLDGVPSLQPLPPERTRNGSTVQDLTREVSDLVRFPNLGTRSLSRQHQEQIRLSMEEVDKCKREYERAYQAFLEAKERFTCAQSILEHQRNVAAALLAEQQEQQRQREVRLQQELQIANQPTLATLLLADPPHKRIRLEQHTAPANPQVSHSSPPSAPPAPQHLISPQLPQPRERYEENPIDLSHAKVTWPQLMAEELWSAGHVMAAAGSSPASQIQIRVLTPPDLEVNTLGARQMAPQPVPQLAQHDVAADMPFFSHLRHKLKQNNYKPLVDPVSPPRAVQENPASPRLQRAIKEPASDLLMQLKNMDQNAANAAPSSALQAERLPRALHPGGAVLHQRPTANVTATTSSADQSQNGSAVNAAEPVASTVVADQSTEDTAAANRKVAPSKTQCIRCHKSSGFVCSSCKLATYCSAECQTSHWSDHEPECTRICQLTRNAIVTAVAAVARPQQPR